MSSPSSLMHLIYGSIATIALRQRLLVLIKCLIFIAKLAFHPSKSNILLSGSTDSLINIYDNNVAEEDDALTQILNHGSSIHHAAFLSVDIVYGLSHDEKFSLYHFNPTQHSDEDAETSRDLAFGDLRETLNCEYVIDVTVSGDGDSAIVAAGSCRYC